MPKERPESWEDTLDEIEGRAKKELPDQTDPSKIHEVMRAEGIEPPSPPKVDGQSERSNQELPLAIETVGQRVEVLEGELDGIEDQEEADKLSYALHYVWNGLRMAHDLYRQLKINSEQLAGAIRLTELQLNEIGEDIENELPDQDVPEEDEESDEPE